MLFGEYLVLKGADCIAFPLKFGQTLSIEPSSELVWESYAKNKLWFSVTMRDDLSIIKTNNSEVAEILRTILTTIRNEAPHLNFKQYFKAEANFQLNWGLGSSSTLISLLSQWSGVDSDKLLTVSFGGSGYDVACATAKTPILYSNRATLREIELEKAITDKMLFVYYGKKQNSRAEIKRFKQSEVTQNHISEANTIIKKVLEADKIETFEKQLDKSESLTSSIIGSLQLKDSLFADYPFSIKSLGAWGGDFFMATFRDLNTAKLYFKRQGYNTMFTYNELIK